MGLPGAIVLAQTVESPLQGYNSQGQFAFPNSTNNAGSLSSQLDGAANVQGLQQNNEKNVLEQGAESLGRGTGPAQTAGQSQPFVKEPPNQFQQFVEQATGRLLPIYGAELFTRKSFNSIANVPVPAVYVVGPGDDIDLKVWGSVDMALRLTVDRNGQITVPKLGPITIAGTRANELSSAITKQLSSLYRNFQVSASLGGLRSIQVYLVGQAKAPGLYTVSGLSTLLSALFESGGPSANGSMRRVELVRNGQTVGNFDVYDFIQSGNTMQDAALQPGDVIVIPPVGPRVALSGALDHPAIYELKSDNESLQTLLGYSGGLRVLTSAHKVQIERVSPDKTFAPRTVVARVLDRVGLQTSVRDGDVLTFFSVSQRFADTVTLRGNVAEPLRYTFKPGMRVSDLIPSPEALIGSSYYRRKNGLVQYDDSRDSSKLSLESLKTLTEVNWSYALVERINLQTLSPELIPFNLAKAVRDKDPNANLELEAGDVITIFSVEDIPVPLATRSHFVSIAGEVMAPGMYQIEFGQTLPDLIKKAGGLSPNAYAFGINFTREATKKAQQENINESIAQLEKQADGMLSKLLQNQGDNKLGGDAAVQAQVAAQQQTIARMRSLVPTGRISLELNPERISFPQLTLQNGDTINIPVRYNFVSVFGEVLGKNTFIYRDDATVADYIERAGLGGEADLDAAILLRVDGTLLSNQAQNSVFGVGKTSFMSAKLQPGDSIYIPLQVDKRSAYTNFIQGAKDWTSILYQFGLGAVGLKSLGY